MSTAFDPCTFFPSQSTTLSNPLLELPDGTQQQLYYNTTGGVALALTKSYWRVDCAGASGAGLIVYSPSGVRYDMTHAVTLYPSTGYLYKAWYTSKITDRNGNYAVVNYAATGSPEISSVTTSDGRTVTFTYLGGGTDQRRVSTVSANGATVTYAYTSVTGGTYQLTSVIRPDGTSWQYAYNGTTASHQGGDYQLNKVVFPEGGSTTYAYQVYQFDKTCNPNISTAAVVTKTSSDGGTWSFSYSPGTTGVYDTTVVTGPEGPTTYQYIGAAYAVKLGPLWNIGTLVSKSVGTLESTSYTWAPNTIATQNLSRRGVFPTSTCFWSNTGTAVPVLQSAVITRDGATYSTAYSGYDSLGNPQGITESGPNGGSRATTIAYYENTSKWIINERQSETFSGYSKVKTFDSNGNVLSITEDGRVTSYVYDSQGNVTQVTEPGGAVYQYASYYRGTPQQETQPASISIGRVVSGAGNVTSLTNGEGYTYSYGYDLLNRLTSVTYPLGAGKTIVYTATSMTATRGALVESTVFDGFRRTISITLGGIPRYRSYDPLGRMTFESNPASTNVGTSYQYDALNRATRITNADASVRVIAYGAGTKTVTDERSNATTYAYRSYGNPSQQLLMSVTAPEPASNLSIQRNTVDLVSSVTQGGYTRSYGYNANYYMTSVVNPETGTTTFGRDGAGNMTSKATGSSGTTSYTYDGQNRLTSVTYPGNTPSVTNTYNKINRLLTASSATGTRTYGYDGNGNMTSEVLAVDALSLSISYGYNSLDQLSSITYPVSNDVVQYSPDALGRPTGVSGYISSVTYWPSGQMQQINYANGVVTTYGQNTRLWPGSFATQGPSGTLYINSSYSYDGVGNLTAISDSVNAIYYNRTLSYDNINRLVGAGSTLGNETISYDGTGNLLTQLLNPYSISYTYDTNNRLSSVSGSQSSTFTYDANGNVISRTGFAYAYDDASNLTCVNCSSLANSVAYTYDAVGHRDSVSKGGSAKTYEVYDARGKPLIEYTPATSRLVEYIYLGDKRIAQKITP